MWSLAALAAFFLLLLGAAWLILFSVFGKRCDGSPNLKYFTADDFEELVAQPVEFPSNRGQILQGNLYSNPQKAPYKGLLIFVHGMGGGHLSYTTEMNTFAQNGFLVLGYDQTGTCSSEGKSLNGFLQSVLDLRAAFSFVNGNDKLNRYPVVLVGHSWGGFTVSQFLQDSPGVKAAVVMSAFEDETKLILDLAKAQTGVPLGFLSPFLKLVTRMKFGRLANRKTSGILKSSDVSALLLHGELDRTVPTENSAASRFVSGECKKISGIIYPGKFHNVYQTRESEQYLNKVFGEINALQKQKKDPNAEKHLKELYKTIDYQKMTEEDPEVMETILTFLNAHIKQS